MRNTLFVGGLAALTLVAAGGVAVAQQATEQTGRHAPAHADTDGDGRISQSEFVGRRVQRLTQADADRDGSVTSEEMRVAMQARRAQHATARFDRIDANKDGAISRAEFDAGAGGRMRHGGDPMRRHGRGGAADARPTRGPVAIADVQARATQAFDRMDGDHDGFITTDERQTARQAMRVRMSERRAAHRGERQASPSAPASE